MASTTNTKLDTAQKKLLNTITGKMLQANGIGDVLVTRIFAQYKNDEKKLKEAIDNDPYCLVDIQGISLKRADTLIVALGFIRGEDEIEKCRNKAVVRLILDTSTNFGNVYLPMRQLKKKAKLEMDLDEFTDVVVEMVESGMLVCEDDAVYLKKYYDAEVLVAGLLKKRVEEGELLPGDIEEIAVAARGGVEFTPSEKMNNLLDALADHVCDMPAHELLEEVKECGEDPEKVAREMKKLLKAVVDAFIVKKKQEGN